MRTDDTIIPLVALLILSLSAVVPVLQITLFYGNVAFFSFFEGFRLFDRNLDLSTVNLIGTAIGTLGYWFSNRVGFKIFWTIVVVFFFAAYIEFERDEIGLTIEPYFLLGLVEAIIAVLPLLIIGLIKEKRSN